MASHLRAIGTGIAAVLIFTAPLQAQDKVRVEGVVVDRATGAPVAHAAVEIADHGQAFTDKDGRFRFDRISQGTVAVTASQLGYAAWVGTLDVTAEGGTLRIELAPNPIEMRAIQVINDRLRARRNAIPYSVRAYEVSDMARSAAWDGFDLVRSRVSVQACPPGLHGSWCVRSRGRLVHPRVVVDDAPLFGGLDALLGWPTEDLYLIEVIRGGQQVRVYTRRFAALLASGRTRLQPVIY